MKLAKKAIGWILSLMIILPLAAGAECAVSARMENGQMIVEWDAGGEECDGCTLTVYRDNWPVLIQCVTEAKGSFSVPTWYTQAMGTYTVRFRANDCCITADAGTVDANGNADAGKNDAIKNDAGKDLDAAMDAPAAPADSQTKPTAAPTAKPTAVPTAKPTAVPTAKPTAAPTAKPTAAPTAKPTAAPTAKPTAVPTAKPTAVPTAKPTAVPVNPSASLADQMIVCVNEDRTANGVGTVVKDAQLTAAACVRAKEIVEKFSHTRPDGSSWSSVYSGAYAENIAKGYSTADKCEAAFLSSQGHRENLLRASYTKIGVCALEYNGVVYWVQLFGK